MGLLARLLLVGSNAQPLPHLPTCNWMVIRRTTSRMGRSQSRRGFTRQPESPNVHISALRRFNTTTKIPREDPPEREGRMKFPAGERKKKSEMLGSPAEGPSTGGGGPGEGALWRRGSAERPQNLEDTKNHEDTKPTKHLEDTHQTS